MKKIFNLVNIIYSRKYIRRCFLPPEYTISAFPHSFDTLQKRLPDMDENIEQSSPIFIFSAGWGSGSTLLQRLIMSRGEVLIWGEPFDRTTLIQRMAASLAAINSDWPPDYHFNQEKNIIRLSNSWIANLSPPPQDLKNAHLNLFKTWFETSLPSYNSKRWGLKEVRLTINHAHYLKWLFPNAKFVFLYRNLADTYQSSKEKEWYLSWPKYKISNFFTFTLHWKILTESFISRHHEVNGLLLRYDDLIGKKFDFNTLTQYLELEKGVDESIFNIKIGSRSQTQKLSRLEKWTLNAIQNSTSKSFPEYFI